MFLFGAPASPPSPSLPPPLPLLSLYIRSLLVVSGFRTSGGWLPLPRWRRPPPLSPQRLSLSLLPLCTLTPSCLCGEVGEGGRATTGLLQGAFTTTANADSALVSVTHDVTQTCISHTHTHTCSTCSTAHCSTGSQQHVSIQTDEATRLTGRQVWVRRAGADGAGGGVYGCAAHTPSRAAVGSSEEGWRANGHDWNTERARAFN